MGQLPQGMQALLDLHAGQLADGGAQRLERRQLGQLMVDEKGGSGCGGLHSLMGHFVQYGGVAVVSDADDYG